MLVSLKYCSTSASRMQTVPGEHMLFVNCLLVYTNTVLLTTLLASKLFDILFTKLHANHLKGTITKTICNGY